MGKVTESIYRGKSVIVPLADVQHIETHNKFGLIVVTRHTRWDRETDTWANNIWIDNAEADAFKAAWCRYRAELEADTLADLTPTKDELMATHDRTMAMFKDDGQFGVGA